MSRTDSDNQFYGSTDTDVWFGADGLTEEIAIEKAAKEARKFSKKFCIDVDLGNGL